MAVGGTIWQGGYQTLTQVLDNQQIILLVLIEEIISAVILNISRMTASLFFFLMTLITSASDHRIKLGLVKVTCLYLNQK